MTTDKIERTGVYIRRAKGVEKRIAPNEQAPPARVTSLEEGLQWTSPYGTSSRTVRTMSDTSFYMAIPPDRKVKY